MCSIKKGELAGGKINPQGAVFFSTFFKNARLESGFWDQRKIAQNLHFLRQINQCRAPENSKIQNNSLPYFDTAHTGSESWPPRQKGGKTPKKLRILQKRRCFDCQYVQYQKRGARRLTNKSTRCSLFFDVFSRMPD